MTPAPDYTYRARLVKVIDGDTLDVDIDLGFTVHVVVRLRLSDIDTPEVRGPERPDGLDVSQFVRQWIGSSDLIVRTRRTGKYGRWLAKVWREGDPVPLAEAIRLAFPRLDL